MRDLLRSYVSLWRDALNQTDWFNRLLARLSLLSLHAACALVLLAAFLIARLVFGASSLPHP